MTRSGVDVQRSDPYRSFNFRVKWDGRDVAGVSKVSLLGRTTDMVGHRDGGDPHSRRTGFAAITLERGVTHDRDFVQWANGVRSGGRSPEDIRRDLVIALYDRAGRLALAYTVFRAWASEFQALPDLHANAHAVAIQHLKLENQGWQRHDAIGGPGGSPFAER